MFILVVVFFYSHFVFLSVCLSCKPSTLVKDILISADLRTGDRHLIKTVVIKLKGHEGSHKFDQVGDRNPQCCSESATLSKCRQF
jgi:hypothetical protein